MSVYRTAPISSLALGIWLTAGVVHADHVLASRGVLGTNLAPTIAVNALTGDVLIVWTQQFLADSTRSQVWASLLKRKPNGTFKKPRKPRRISPKQGFHSNARVAWLPAKRAFFAVWDTRRLPGVASKILGRKISSNGKASGGTKTLVSDGRENFGPAIQPDDPFGRVVYIAKDVALSVGDQNLADVLTLGLRRNLLPESEKIVDVFTVTSGDPTTERFAQLLGDCHLLLIQNDRGSTMPSITVAMLRNGREVRRLDILDATYASSVVLPDLNSRKGTLVIVPVSSPKRFVSFTVCEALNVSSGPAINRIYPDLPAWALASEFPPIFPRFARGMISTDDRVAARGPAVYDLVVAVGGELRSQGFNENGRQTGLRQTLATDVGGALFLNGATLPAARNGSASAPDGILTWLVGKGTGSEIRALAVTRD